MARLATIRARLLRGLDPHGFWRMSWFVIHQHDMVQHVITNFSAELWGWDEELAVIAEDRDLWFAGTEHGIELPLASTEYILGRYMGEQFTTRRGISR